MKIAAVEVEPYEVELRSPLPSPSGALRSRRGWLLRLHDEAGAVGIGEAGPAYWLGDESLAAVEAVLGRMTSLAGACAPLEDLPDWRRRSPAAACALETAALDLEGRATGRSVAELLGGAEREIEVSALLVADRVEAIERAACALAARGYRSFKLKVGLSDPSADVRRVAALRRILGTHAVLRLDANRAWRLEEARRALAAFAPFAPAFVEEPLRSGDPEEWRALRDAAGEERPVPLAADESVGGLRDLHAFAATGALDVLVLKAARLGGATAMLEMALAAQRLGIAVVVTDSIETSVGRALAAHTAAAIEASPQPVGLGGAILMSGAAHGSFAIDQPRIRVAGPGLGI